jgi:DcuC family C4-dicarboxylate transporter
MRAAGFHPLVIGSALLLGASVGGELFNPGAPELNTVKDKTGADTVTLARVHLPWVVIPQLAVSLLVFWALTRWWWKEGVVSPSSPRPEGADTSPAPTGHGEGPGGEVPTGRINWLKAAVPLVPLVLLLLSGPPLNVIKIPPHWLVEVKAPDVGSADERLVAVAGPAAVEAARLERARAEKAGEKAAGGRMVGLAMVIGAAVAGLTSRKKAGDTAKAFFGGAGYGFANIVSLIVVAVAFGKAVELAGFGEVVKQLAAAAPWLLVPLAVVLPWAFAVASGSGMASTASLYGFFHEPAVAAGINPNDVGALVSIGSAAGRTMSPVAAVAVMCGNLTSTTPWALAGRVAIPLLAGLTVVIVLRMCGLV